MTEDTRTIKAFVTTEDHSVDRQELHRAFACCGDRFFHQDIPDFEIIAGETEVDIPEEHASNPGETAWMPAVLSFKTDADPVAMEIEARSYLFGELPKGADVQTTVLPTDEEIEKMHEEQKEAAE